MNLHHHVENHFAQNFFSSPTNMYAPLLGSAYVMLSILVGPF